MAHQSLREVREPFQDHTSEGVPARSRRGWAVRELQGHKGHDQRGTVGSVPLEAQSPDTGPVCVGL